MPQQERQQYADQVAADIAAASASGDDETAENLRCLANEMGLGL